MTRNCGRAARSLRARHGATITLAVTENEAARMAEAVAGAAILGTRLVVLPAPVSAAAVSPCL